MILALIVILPLLLAAFLTVVLYKDPAPIKYIALGASIVSLLLALYIFLFSQSAYQSFSWFSLPGYTFSVSTITAPMNMMLLLLVSVITVLIFLYSMGFMDRPSEQARFYAEMCVFAAAMMLFSVSASFITLIIAWEMLGITSYLLIGFFYWKDAPPTAARKAITTIIIGDMAMLAAVVILLNGYHTLEFSQILAAPATPALTLAMSLVLIAVFTKSAQFPFHEWLSDAMEGPTPVSAFLHSSTMVKAGVFLVAVLLPLFQESGLSWVILVIGLLSAVLGASNALTERHIKKILAYSTIEDIGLMFVALGLGSLFAALMLFMAQAFYKALLFMGAGAVMKANDDREDIFNIYNSSSNKILFGSMAVGALSIAAFPPLGGFFGKALVDGGASSNLAVYAVLLVIGLATSLYTFRWLFVPMRHDGNRARTELIALSTVPKSMMSAIVVLAVFAAASSLLYIYMPPYLPGAVAFAQIGLAEALLSAAVAVAGLAIAYMVYIRGMRTYMSSTHRMVYSVFHNSTAVNIAYSGIVAFFLMLAEAVARFDYAFDKATYIASDYFITLGRMGRALVNGQTNTYVLAFALGIAVLALVFLLQ
jgi:NADH-quinone oxidoreductase subunit L